MSFHLLSVTMLHIILGKKGDALYKGKDLVSTPCEAGRTLLHLAADYGQADVITYLIDMGADIESVDKYGITPLLAAIYENHSECVKILLSKGAKKDGKSPNGKSYIECAETDDIKELLK